MSFFLNEYFFVLVFVFLACCISCVLFVLSFFVGNRRADQEKISPYECGFNPFEDARQPFDVRFYLVAILFIVFDLEVMYLFPWAVALCDLGVDGFVSMYIFLFILLVGFCYEWSSGALDWD